MKKLLVYPLFLLTFSFSFTFGVEAEKTPNWGKEINGIRVALELVVPPLNESSIEVPYFLIKIQNNFNKTIYYSATATNFGVYFFEPKEKKEVNFFGQPLSFSRLEVAPGQTVTNKICIDPQKLLPHSNTEIVGVIGFDYVGKGEKLDPKETPKLISVYSNPLEIKIPSEISKRSN